MKPSVAALVLCFALAVSKCAGQQIQPLPAVNATEDQPPAPVSDVDEEADASNFNGRPRPGGLWGRLPSANVRPVFRPGFGSGFNPGFGQGINPGFNPGFNPVFGNGFFPGFGQQFPGFFPGFGR